MKLTVLLVVAFFSAATPASADVLCKTRRSKVVVRTACRAEETPLNVDTLGLRGEKGDKGDSGEQGTTGATGAQGPMGEQGPTGPVGSQGSTGPQGIQGQQGPVGPEGVQGAAGPGLAVRDANGAIVGQVLQEVDILNGSAIEVYREVEGGKYRFLVRRDGIMNVGPSIAINFDGADCTGSAFFQVESLTVDTGALLDQAYVHNNALYYRSGASTPSSQLSQMFFPVDSVAACSGGISQLFIPPAACCRTFASASLMNGYPVSTFDLNTLGLVTPFHVEEQ